MLVFVFEIIFIAAIAVLLFDFFYLAKKRRKKMLYVPVCEWTVMISAVVLGLKLYNFEAVLTFAVIIFGVIYLLDNIVFKKVRQKRLATALAEGELEEHQHKFLKGMPVLVDYSRSFFFVLLIVLCIRSWVVEPFRIPSGSLEPSLLTGDFILVDKFVYGLRLPVTNQVIIPTGKPKRGDIAVFHWPVNPNVDFIKRVVGVPGDKISYINKVFYINGIEAKQEFVAKDEYLLEDGMDTVAIRKQEDLLGVEHEIYNFPDRPAFDFQDIVVPEGMYFMVGDNRDDSADSRFWGFVDEKYMVGKPLLVLLSWQKQDHKVRWSRSGMKVK